MIVTVTNYFDVWGNARDGWEVNNQFRDDYHVRKFDIYDRSAVLRFLKHIGFFRKNVRIKSVGWECYSNGYEICAKNGCPLCAIEEKTE